MDKTKTAIVVHNPHRKKTLQEYLPDWQTYSIDLLLYLVFYTVSLVLIIKLYPEQSFDASTINGHTLAGAVLAIPVSWLPGLITAIALTRFKPINYSKWIDFRDRAYVVVGTPLFCIAALILVGAGLLVGILALVVFVGAQILAAMFNS